jgi:uncharacterized membrane protein
MVSELNKIVPEDGRPDLKPPSLPIAPSEITTVLCHYYRGELSRMISWRDRIDRTSNWAITVTAALLSVSLSTPTSHHGVVLFAMLLTTLLLLIEARRYRFFDVYRARVRRLERGYFAQILAPQTELNQEWAAAIAKSLLVPSFIMGYREALERRLRRNYCWMYLILLLAWALKISAPDLQPGGAPANHVRSWSELAANAALGPVPGWIVIIAVIAAYLCILYGAIHREPDEGEFAHGRVHV